MKIRLVPCQEGWSASEEKSGIALWRKSREEALGTLIMEIISKVESKAGVKQIPDVQIFPL